MRYEELRYRELQKQFYEQQRIVNDAEHALSNERSKLRKVRIAMQFAHIDDMIAQQKYSAAIYYYDAYKIQMTRAEIAFFARKGYTPKNCKSFAGVQMQYPWPVTIAHDIDVGDGMCDLDKLSDLLSKKEDFTILVGMYEFDITYDDDYHWDGEEERYHDFITISGMYRGEYRHDHKGTSITAADMTKSMYAIMDKF